MAGAARSNGQTRPGAHANGASADITRADTVILDPARLEEEAAEAIPGDATLADDYAEGGAVADAAGAVLGASADDSWEAITEAARTNSGAVAAHIALDPESADVSATALGADSIDAATGDTAAEKKGVRRGIIFNVISSIALFLTGYVLHFFFGKAMSATEYGLLGTIITVLDFEYMFLSNGARQSIAKAISMRQASVRDIVLKTTAFQLLVVAFFWSVNFFGAPVFANVLHSDALDFYFKAAAFLVPANGMFVLVLGVNDGLHRFTSSAVISTAYTLMKLCAIPFILFIFPNKPIFGMEMGYLTALLVATALGLLMLIPARQQMREYAAIVGKLSFGDVAKSTMSFSVFFIMVSLVLSVDTLVVKAVIPNAADAGYYTGAVNMGKIAYYLVSAFCTVILPVVAKEMGQGNRRGAIKHTSDFIAAIVALILPISMIVSASASTVLKAFYNASYDAGAPALTFLSFSSFFMGMTVFFNMVHTSFASNRFSDILSIISLVVVVPIFVFAAKSGGISTIGLASACCTFVTMVASYIALVRHTGRVFSRRTWAALSGNAALWIIIFLLFRFWHTSSLVLVVAVYAVAYLLFVGIMVATHVIDNPLLLLKGGSEERG